MNNNKSFFISDEVAILLTYVLSSSWDSGILSVVCMLVSNSVNGCALYALMTSTKHRNTAKNFMFCWSYSEKLVNLRNQDETCLK